ncbi:terpenoid synthase [Macrolepiota fuliginosa MF-IS2]|uniref:Terpenoid synthase n=1 Tax=Macrolepiota fuliginosa MF-IS2 TaxID=1400762 RepID=A0A9P6C0X0_9AGAR|nr:terpenoid synthase [Macrolepiota fuliginosa MF-IS2]
MSQIKDILANFLQQCDISYPRQVCLDQPFQAACYADAERRGLDMELLKKPIDVGIAIGSAAYEHLENQSTRVFIAIWTGLLTYVDDVYESYSDGLNEFFERFTHKQPQRYQVLDQIVTMIHELPQHWGIVGSNLILTAEMDFLTSTIIDNIIEGMEFQPLMAPGFPQFTRRMGGISRAYAIMVFPPELDLKSWIQVMPDFMHYINHVNDLLSFFKEELAGETLNFVSMSASANGITKVEALRRLANKAARCYERGSGLLRSSPDAWNAYRAFCVGYVGFHVLSVRYKLDQLDL